jgi:hypothetical protein
MKKYFGAFSGTAAFNKEKNNEQKEKIDPRFYEDETDR